MDYKNCLDYVYRFTQTTVINRKSLLELTTYENTTLWFFVSLRFHNFICRGLNCDNKQRAFKRIQYLLYKFSKLTVDVSLLVLIKCLMIGYNKPKAFQDLEKKHTKILFTAQDIEWRPISDNRTDYIKKTDAFFDSIITKLITTNGFNLVGVYPLSPSIRSLTVFVDKLKNWPIPHKPLNLYWSPDVSKKEREASKHFKEVWSALKSDEFFKDLCVSGKAELYPQIAKEVGFYFNVQFPYAIKHIEMAKRMIEIEKPDLMLIQNEYGFFERALVIAGKLKGIPTLAIQHGIITPTHQGYMFGEELAEKLILPDVTCVSGRYYYDLLTKNSIYKPEQVVVTGQPRYDNLYNVAEAYSKSRFLKTYGIDIKNKIIFWATQCHGMSDEENRRYFKLIFGTMQKFKDHTLIIKQHPGENEKYTRMIKNHIAQYDANLVLTSKDSNTYEQLYVCDLMITKNSTTAIEAVALNKPVIVLNLSGKPDVVNYVEEGIALGVYRENDLEKALETLLKDDSELAKSRTAYIEKYLYKLDGNSTERVLNEINMLLHKKKHMQIEEN